MYIDFIKEKIYSYSYISMKNIYLVGYNKYFFIYIFYFICQFYLSEVISNFSLFFLFFPHHISCTFLFLSLLFCIFNSIFFLHLFLFPHTRLLFVSFPLFISLSLFICLFFIYLFPFICLSFIYLFPFICLSFMYLFAFICLHNLFSPSFYPLF